MVKATPNFKKKLDETRIARVSNGLDTEMKSYSEIIEATTRYSPLWEILKNAEFKRTHSNVGRKPFNRKSFVKDRSGDFPVFNIYYFIVVAFLVVVFFAGLIYVMGLINGVFQQVGLANEVNAGKVGYVNMSLAADQTIGVINNSIQSLKMVALVYILCLAISIILTNALLKIHPLFFFPYVLIVILGVIFAAPISNAYETLLNSGIYNGGLTSFTGSNFILLNLPAFVLGIGMIGGIFLFISLLKHDAEPTIR